MLRNSAICYGMSSLPAICVPLHSINLRSYVFASETFCSACWFHPPGSCSASHQKAQNHLDGGSLFSFPAGEIKFKSQKFLAPPTVVRFVTKKEDLAAFLTETLYLLFPVDCDTVADEVAVETSDTPMALQPEPEKLGATSRTLFWPLALSAESRPNHTIRCGKAHRQKSRDKKSLANWLPESFPRVLSLEKFSEMFQALAAEPPGGRQTDQTVWYMPTKERNPGCDVVGLTYISETKTLEVTLLELKDRRSIHSEEIVDKLRIVCCTTLWQRFRDKHPDVRLSIELVIAGPCDHQFLFLQRTGTVDDCVIEAKKQDHARQKKKEPPTSTK